MVVVSVRVMKVGIDDLEPGRLWPYQAVVPVVDDGQIWTWCCTSAIVCLTNSQDKQPEHQWIWPNEGRSSRCDGLNRVSRVSDAYVLGGGRPKEKARRAG